MPPKTNRKLKSKSDTVARLKTVKTEYKILPLIEFPLFKTPKRIGRNKSVNSFNLNEHNSKKEKVKKKND